MNILETTEFNRNVLLRKYVLLKSCVRVSKFRD